MRVVVLSERVEVLSKRVKKLSDIIANSRRKNITVVKGIKSCPGSIFNVKRHQRANTTRISMRDVEMGFIE